ncbi:MAG: GNAT family N-acetyltransferase [Chloroflexi bacterium]|nr:GNAT family N-acetyltransferase [Chloroflexota bacterium]
MVVTLSIPSVSAGLRPVNLRTDLAPLADLIELAFADTMDSSGRAAIREMRTLSRVAPGLGALLNVNEVAQGIGLGYVWIEDGRLVGNTSVYPAHLPRSFGSSWIIANVAVHPDYRGRGIARQLMQASMDMIRKRGHATTTVLQVEDGNDVARHLYESLGFTADRTFHIWRRSSTARIPAPQDAVYITRRRPDEWKAEYDLAQRVRPNAQGGMGWLRPLTTGLFRPSLTKMISDLFNMRSIERLIVRTDTDHVLRASLWIESAFASSSVQLSLLVDPDYAGVYDDALLNLAARRFGLRSALMIEHPADDILTNAILQKYAFTRQRSLVHMTWRA